MASVSYDEIYSSFYTTIDDYSLTAMYPSDAFQIMGEYLRKSLSRPYIRNIFETVTRHDDIHTLEYTLVRENTVDEQADSDFVIMLLGAAMAYEWVSPKVESLKNVSQIFGSSDEKWFSQSSHLSQLMSLKDAMYAEVQRLISDYGFSSNTYLDGTSIAATQRQVTS